MAAAGVPAPHRLCRPSLFPIYTIKHELGLLSISHRSSSPPPRLHSAAPKLHRRRSPLAADPLLRRLSLPSELPGESSLLSSLMFSPLRLVHGRLDLAVRRRSTSEPAAACRLAPPSAAAYPLAAAARRLSRDERPGSVHPQFKPSK
jgi:hypothetical protein